MQAWRDFMPLLGENVGQMLLYLLFLILIAIGIAIASCIVGLIATLVVLLPFALVYFALIALGGALGLGWTQETMVAAGLLGIVLFIPAMILMQTVMQPFTAFRRSFSLAVLGQADQSLALIPTAPPNMPTYPR